DRRLDDHRRRRLRRGPGGDVGLGARDDEPQPDRDRERDRSVTRDRGGRRCLVATRDTILVTDRTDAAVAAGLQREIGAFTIAATGIADAGELFAEVRDEDGALVAGVDGWTWGGTCWIEHLWVRAADRGTGIGARLLAAVEDEARRRGARQIGLSTHSFH